MRNNLWLLNQNKKLKIALVGPSDFFGSASLAAGAMLNIFGEIEYDSLENRYGLEKIKMLIKAKKMWRAHLNNINKSSNDKVNLRKGTIILNNGASDSLDDLNFKSIVLGLKNLKKNLK